MAALIGLVVGAAIGHWWFGERGAMLGGLLGFFAGALLASQRERRAHRKPDAPAAIAPARADATLGERVAVLEGRVRALEQALAQNAVTRTATESIPVIPIESTPAAVVEPVTSAEAASEAPVAPAVTAAPYVQPASSASAEASPAPAVPEPFARRSIFAAIWAWFTGGNAITRIGVVVLFFGVAFLLKYFAEHFTVPIELRLLGVAAAGAALVVLGLRIARTRPAYGWSLQGAGMGVLYLTTYAAFREFTLIGAGPALVLLALAAAATVWLAIVADSQALAALAVMGAFLAPVLTGSDRDPLPLFSYFAVVNGVVLVTAWWRGWRAVTLIGFAFTFVLGLFWGYRYYQPRNFAVVEPFLVAFFAAYVAMTIAHARAARADNARAGVLDGLLVFGVPIIAFTLQAALLRDTRYGAAWSAVGAAGVYAGLAFALRRRVDGAMTMLSRAFVLLAAVFASIAIPFAFENRITAALWSIEGVLVFWLGVQQRTAWTRALACALQLAAAAMFLASGMAGADRLFANPFFIGALMIAIAGLATGLIADRHADRLTPGERGLISLVVAWGSLWWIAAGTAEIVRRLPRTDQAHAVLAWVTASSLLAIVACRTLPWHRILALGIALPVVMLLVMLRDVADAHTTLAYAGWLAWPVAWVAAFALLATLDDQTRDDGAHRPWRDTAHAAAALVLVGQIAWELSEWTGRITAEDTVWLACAAALPAIGYLSLMTADASTRLRLVADHRRAYTVTAATPIAVLLAMWVLLVNLFSPGEPFPLPYVPVANPLELELILALIVMFRWSARRAGLDERSRYALLGAGLFVCLNGAILRVGHHWGDIPWDLADLLASRPLQAALTLAWSATGVALMYMAARRALRTLWMVGAALLALVVVKLFVVDLAALSGLPRVVAFLGVGALLLAIGYVSPLPPSASTAAPNHGEH